MTYVNPALEELTGYDAEHHHAASWLERIHRDDRQSALDLWQYSLESGEDFLQQYRYYRQDGDMLWLEVHARRVVSGDVHLGSWGR